MSTKSLNPALSAALTAVPATFRSRLIKAYVDLKQNTLEGRHDPAGLETGKFCEVALRFLQQKVHGASTPFGTRMTNFSDECRRLAATPTTSGNESDRVVIPRALDFLYTMRNKRGIGHVGGDVDANGIDIATMARTADWILCELIRINHGVSLERSTRHRGWNLYAAVACHLGGGRKEADPERRGESERPSTAPSLLNPRFGCLAVGPCVVG